MDSSAKVVRPDFEVSIRRHEGDEALLVGIFIEEDGKVDFGIGWDCETELNGLRALLEVSALALSTIGDWKSVSDIHTYNEQRKNEGDELPF